MKAGAYIVTDTAIPKEYFKPAYWDAFTYQLAVEPDIYTIAALVGNLKEWTRQLEAVANELRPHTA